MLQSNGLKRNLFGVDLNSDLPKRGRLPDFSDRRHDREPGADVVLANYGFCDVVEF